MGNCVSNPNERKNDATNTSSASAGGTHEQARKEKPETKTKKIENTTPNPVAVKETPQPKHHVIELKEKETKKAPPEQQVPPTVPVLEAPPA